MALQVGPEHAAQEAGQRPQAVVVQGRRPLAEVVHEQVADRAAGEPVAVDELAGGGGAVGAQLGQRGRGLLAEHSDPAQHPVEHPGPVCLPRVDLRLDVEQLQHVAHGDLGHRAAMILAAKGGPMAEITVGDVLELFDVEAQVNAREAHGAGVFYRMLRGVGMLGEQAPATLAQLRTDGPATPGQLIDRYRLACRPVRDLLVDYLSERAPALDYNSLRSLARFLGSVFWADLERHHPGIDSLHLPTDVATAWKRRLRTATTTPRAATAVPGGAAGGAPAAPATRVGYRECLTPRCARSTSIWPAGPARTRPGGRAGSLRVRSAPRRSTAARPCSRARPGWTPAPGRGCARCPRCSTSSPANGPRRRSRWRRPGRPRRGRPARSGRRSCAAASCGRRGRPRSGSMSWPPAGAATSPSKKTTPSGCGLPSRCFARPGSASKSC